MVENVIGGLMVAALGVLWRYVVLPGVQLFYGRGEPNISGQWESYDNTDCSGMPVGEAMVKQRGRHVRIRLIRTVGRSGRTIRRTMLFKGRWQSEQLTATFYDTSAHYRGGAVVLRWVASEDPIRLVGRVIYWDRTPDAGTRGSVDSMGIVSSPYGLRKKS
ncbi:hypothetical protein ACFUIT_36425 [Streptomyces sp. NPDC057239]|uniref:hypothetical protein n=1 Tax=Streptomyces sp. NPDC057239 TaxID=3346061 RepID=UPI003645E32F